jgi:hypothetical protein
MLDLIIYELSHVQMVWNKVMKIPLLTATPYQQNASIVGCSFVLQSLVSYTNEKWNALFVNANWNLEIQKRGYDIINSTHNILTALNVKFVTLDSSERINSKDTWERLTLKYDQQLAKELHFKVQACKNRNTLNLKF